MSRSFNNNSFGMLLVLAASVGLALATGAGPSCGTFGWNYGAAYCGPLGGSANIAQCNTCCMAAPLTAAQAIDCRAFCAFATYPPAPSIWDKIIGWF